MKETVKAIIYMLQHDPWVVIGLVLLGASSVLFAHVQFKLRDIGYKKLFALPSDWGLPNQYLKVRSEHNWSAWPVYALWLCFVLGIVLLVLGLFRLQQ